MQVVLLIRVKGTSPRIFNTKDPEILFFTDVYLWKFENEKLENKYSYLHWKYGDRDCNEKMSQIS